MLTTNKTKAGRGPMAVICMLGIGVGVLAVIAGVAWAVLGGGRMMYTQEQAKEYSSAASALHSATSGHDHSGGADKGPATDRDAAVAAARERFDRAEAALKSAKFAQNELGAWLMGLGLAVTVAFGIGYVASRGDQ
jgi:hypothetical protein